MHLRLHRFYSSANITNALQLQSSAVAHRLGPSTCAAALKSRFIRRVPFLWSLHAENKGEKPEMSARRSDHCDPTSEVTGGRAGDKQSVSPAFRSCLSTVVVAGSISALLLLLLLLRAPAPVCTLQYQLRFYGVYPEMATVLLPQDHASSATTRAIHFSPISPPTDHCSLLFIASI